MDLQEFLRDKVGGAAIGAALTWLLTKFQARTARFRFSTRIDRIATAATNPIFGPLAITWSGTAVRNLSLATIEVENESGRDFKDVPFTVFCEKDTFILNEQTWVIGSPHIVPWTEEFANFIKVAPGMQPTQAQLEKYYHRREYLLPVLNRGQVIQFTYVCNRPNDDQTPHIFIDSQMVGARMRREDRSQIVFGVPNRDAMIYGWVVSTVLVVLSAHWVQPRWMLTAVSYIIGLTVLVIGAVVYKSVRALRRLIGG